MKNIKAWTLTWLVMLTAFITLSLMPRISLPNSYNLDKIAHFSGCLVLATTSFYLLKLKKRVVIAIILLAIISIVTELIQIYVPGRTASYADAAANFSGIVVGSIIGLLFLKLKK